VIQQKQYSRANFASAEALSGEEGHNEQLTTCLTGSSTQKR
jgi:hypothetical protein